MNYLGAMLGATPRERHSGSAECGNLYPYHLFVMLLCALISFQPLEVWDWAAQLTWQKAFALAPCSCSPSARCSRRHSTRFCISSSDMTRTAAAASLLLFFLARHFCAAAGSDGGRDCAGAHPQFFDLFITQPAPEPAS